MFATVSRGRFRKSPPEEAGAPPGTRKCCWGLHLPPSWVRSAGATLRCALPEGHETGPTRRREEAHVTAPTCVRSLSGDQGARPASPLEVADATTRRFWGPRTTAGGEWRRGHHLPTQAAPCSGAAASIQRKQCVWPDAPPSGSGDPEVRQPGIEPGQPREALPATGAGVPPPWALQAHAPAAATTFALGSVLNGVGAAVLPQSEDGKGGGSRRLLLHSFASLVICCNLFDNLWHF